MNDVIVIGAGAVGLAIARELASRNLSVLVLERDTPGQGTSWAAAGMLTPQSESTQADAFFDLALGSLRMYRAWAAGLTEETGMDAGFVESGALRLALSLDELEVLERGSNWQRAAGLRLETLSAEETLKLEPAISAPVAGAIWLPDECQITPRRMTCALLEGCLARRVEIRSGQRVEAILKKGSRVDGVQVNGARIPAGQVIVASGVWSPEIAGLDPPIPVYPRKGQILSLAVSGRLFHRMLRWGHVYAVTRPSTSGSGELVIGATNENVGFDRSLTPQGIGGLMMEAQRVCRGTASLPIAEMWSGLRPATPDDRPVIGRSGVEGLIYATGHYRNGILLAPITASVIAALATGQAPPFSLDAFSPSRFRSAAV